MNNSEKLTNLLGQVAFKSQYYRELLIDKSVVDITSFPVLTKEILYKNKDRIIIDEYKNTLLKECSVHLSSGTVGRPVEVYWHYNDEMISNLSLWRLRAKYHDIKPNNRVCTLHTTNYSWNRIADYKKIVYSQDQKTLSLCKLFFDEENMMLYYNEIIKFQPEWLFFQPSNFVKLTDFMMRNNLQLPVSIRYIEFTGETLISEAIKMVKEIYRCSYSNMYGTTETNGIAYMCPYGKMHVLEDNVHLEVDQGDCGKARVTSLTNLIFPMIRYEVGDILELNNCDCCLCGQHGKVIKTIKGRAQNVVKLPNGNTISEVIIMSIMDRVKSLTGNSIREYKVRVLMSRETMNFIIYIDHKSNEREDIIKRQIHNVILKYFESSYNVMVDFVYKPIGIEDNGKFSILEVIK